MARPCIFAHTRDNQVQIIDLEPGMEDDLSVIRAYVHRQMNWTHSILVILDLKQHEHNLGFYAPQIVRCFMQPERVMEFYSEATDYGVQFVESATDAVDGGCSRMPPKLPPRRSPSLRKSSDSIDTVVDDLISF
ncbi:hypothetical protein LPJ56_000954 [Coemansia sp. RSA 2599]|nr:hypothetical protein LPJ75_000268 [Coemansia sp. RSA 2598]KAJ1828691.1 hypothetical protein LPJ56_000954 [Coemansia sp. RSA 2599]